jgi:hypothetical protein
MGTGGVVLATNAGGAEVGGAEVGAAETGAGTLTGAGVAAAQPGETGAAGGPLTCAGAAAAVIGRSHSAPSATTSSGWSITIGAMRSVRCSSVAASGIRDEPPTRNTPPMRSGGMPASCSVARVVAAVRSSCTRAAFSNSSRVIRTCWSTRGRWRSPLAYRDSCSFTARADCHRVWRARWSAEVCGQSRRRQASAAVAVAVRACSTTAASRSSPPTSGRPAEATTSNPPGEGSRMLRSNVPAPRSYTTMPRPAGIRWPSTVAK